MHRLAFLLATYTAALLQAGCGSAPATGEGKLADALLQQDRTGSWRRLTNTENGLEVHKWLIDDNGPRIAAAMSQFAAGAVLDELDDKRLARNGFRFITFDLDDMDALLTALGGASVNVQGWHGQILDWRALHELALGKDAATLAIDGRMRRFDGGTLALLARAWTVQMEDGPFLQLEMVPEHRHAASKSDLLKMLRSGGHEREALPSMSVDVRLRRGKAYLLTFEEPGNEWAFTSDDDTLAATDPPAAADDESRTTPGVGPVVEAPPTLGQKLLWSRTTTAQRGVLILIPKIPDALYPPELLDAVDGQRTAAASEMEAAP